MIDFLNMIKTTGMKKKIKFELILVVTFLIMTLLTLLVC